MKTVLAFVILATAAVAEVEIAQPFLYHGEEFHGTSGTWWGLYAKGEHFDLRETPVTVDAAEDQMFDAPGETTGKQVATGDDPEKQPLLLIRGVSGWRAGKVDTHLAQGSFAYPGQLLRLASQDPYCVLLGTGTGKAGEYGPMITDYGLHLIAEPYDPEKKRTQTILTAKQIDEEGQPSLVWAGDLDRDGKTDLIMNLSDHYNVSHLALYLSSAAKDGELVGKVAALITTGC